MARGLRGPEWKVEALLRILPFVGFLIVVFGVVAGDYPALLGFILMGILGALSIAAWLVWSAGSRNGQ
jgi:hypothetical protein